MITDAQISEIWFGQHVAEFDVYSKRGAHVHQLDWGRPRSSEYFVRYLINGPVLSVTGDCGDAIYRIHRKLAFEWLAGLDVGYFAEKCVASEAGRSYCEWDPAEARACVESVLTRIEEEDAKQGLAARSACRQCDDYSSDIWEAAGAKWHLEQWLLANANDAFGPDWIDTLDSDCGMTVSRRCRAHLIGIQMAVAQRRKQPG